MKWLFLLLLCLLPSAAFCQTAEHVVPGLEILTSKFPKWVPISSTNPLPIGVYDQSNNPGYCYTSNGSASPATFQSCGGGGGSTYLGTSKTAPAPSASVSDTQTGLYTAGAGKIDFTAAGTQIGEFSSAGLNLYNGALTAIGSTTLSNLGVAPYYAANSGVVCDGSTSINTNLATAFAAASAAGNKFVILPPSASAASSTSTSFATSVMTVGGTITGTFAVGQTIFASGVTNGTKISTLGTGTGGAGTYNLSTSPGTITAEYVSALKPCIISSAINVPTGMWLMGMGMGNTVITTSTSAPNYSMISLAGNNGGVANLTVNALMTSGGSGGYGGIYVSGNYNKVTYNEAAYTTTSGINVQDGSNNEVAYNYVHNTGSNGITVNAGNYPPLANYNWIHDNDVEYSAIIGTAFIGSGDNIDIDPGSNYTRVEHNYSLCNDIILFENTTFGTTSVGNSIVGNTIVGCSGITNYPGGVKIGGIDVAASENEFEVANNIIFNSPSYSLKLDGAQNNFSVHDNFIYNPGTNGIIVLNAADNPGQLTGVQNNFSIYGNKIFTSGSTGISVGNSDTNGVVQNNYVYVGTTAAYSIDTTAAAATMIVKDNYVTTGTTGVINNNANQAVYNNLGPGEGGQNFINLQQEATGNNPLIQSLGVDTNIGLDFATKGSGTLFFQTESTVTQLEILDHSAVNYFTLNGQSTGNSPTIAVAGSDTNIGMLIQSKGTGGIHLNTGGNDQVIVVNTASAVNHFTETGGATGFNPTLTATGSDSNVGMIVSTKGSGQITFQGQSATQVVINPTASAVNYFTLNGQSTGNSPTIAVAGSDTNIGMLIQSKGTGGIHLNTGGNDQMIVNNVASAVNYLNVTGQSTGNNPTISSAGSDTNVGLNIQTQGSGSTLFAGSSVTQFEVLTTPSAVNYLSIDGQTTGNSPTIQANGSDNNVGMLLEGKGTGGIHLNTNGSDQVVVTSSGVAVGTSSNSTYQMLVKGTAGSTLAVNSLPVINKVVIQTFAAGGTYTPTTGMQYVFTEVCGGGGGGGGAAAAGTTTASFGSGGGAGGYASDVLTASAIGANQTVTIGTAGAAATAGANNGGAGGASSVGSLLSVGGGSGGVGQAAAAVIQGSGGTGGSVTTGGSASYVGGQGGIAFSLAATGFSGNGASSAFGAGGGGWAAGGSANQPGRAASGHCAGGSGGESEGTSGTNEAGGAGTGGFARFTEYISN